MEGVGEAGGRPVKLEIRDLEVSVTITTDREDVRAFLEPGASKIAERLAYFRELDKKAKNKD